MNTNRTTHKINEPILPSSVVHNNLNIMSYAKGDSGASQHYITQADQHLLHSKESTSDQNVLLPNNQNITSTEKGLLPLSHELTTKACTAHVLPSLHTSIISLGQLADDNCTIILNKNIYMSLKIINLFLLDIGSLLMGSGTFLFIIHLIKPFKK